MRDAPQSTVTVSAVFAYAASITACNIIPLQVPAFAEVQGLDSEQIGAVAMCEVLALALTAIFASTLPVRMRVYAGLMGAGFVVAGQLVTVGAPGFLWLLVVRGVVGLGCGLAAAAVAHTMARSADPASAFGLANGLSAVLIGALLMGIPWLPSADPGARVFVPLALLGAVLLVTTHLATRHCRVESPRGGAQEGETARKTDFRTVASLGISTLLIFIPLGGIWAFSVHIGLDAGLTEKLIGGMLVFAVIGGFVGGNAAAWVDRRIGTLRMVVVAVAFTAAACVIVGTVEGAITFAVVFCVYSAAYQFGISSFQIAAASADSAGQLPGILLGLTLVGYALGSYAVGLLLNMGYYDAIWIGGGVFCLIAGVPAMVTMRQVLSRTQSPTSVSVGSAR